MMEIGSAGISCGPNFAHHLREDIKTPWDLQVTNEYVWLPPRSSVVERGLMAIRKAFPQKNGAFDMWFFYTAIGMWAKVIA